ncbi:MAG: hypothetical protein QXM12_07910, partial [Nitrososphaerota archaeon]
MSQPTADFIVKWFVGPIAGLAGLEQAIMREIGLCPNMEEKGFFIRESLTTSEVERLFKQADINNLNIFMGVGFWLSGLGRTPQQDKMIYDRLSFDFDNEIDPLEAVEGAVKFARTIREKHDITPIVFESGHKGAHVIIPLSRPTNWTGYQLLWDYFYELVPEEFKKLVDKNMKQWNRLDRVPQTFNIRGRRKELAKIIVPEVVGEFSWKTIRGLDPSQITIYAKPNLDWVKIKARPPKKREPRKGAMPPCMVKLLDDARQGVELSHNARLALASYLLNTGLGLDEVVDVFRNQPDFRESITRYQVNYIATYDSGKPLITYSCQKMKELGLCIADCGVKTPLSYRS